MFITAVTAATAERVSVRNLIKASLVAVVLAALAAEVLTALVRAAGVDLAVGNPGGKADSVVPVAFGACAISLTLAMIAGTLLALLINRFSSHPARTYIRTTIVLTVASLAAPLTAAGTSTATKLTLIAVHLTAASIIIPAVGRRLGRP
ncbi:DUF6069 family protein [Streptomyces sp. SID13031]|uniref:DUF6069 family protein n=1 Tax=Streptomyces sp. SID13031 TaxID=2706046 RepID=UPI0013CC644A|nr:DUF6069 family protein [Streptomyces sp. SID13031]NEA34330.1 hypothetical protein [Streptomyces sp. SID13031]